MITLTRKQAMPIIKASFPTYNGRKIKVMVNTQVHLSDLNWSGGTRSEYKFIGANGRVAMADNSTHPWYNRQEGAVIELKSGTYCVEHTIFCGKDLGLTVYIHPDDMPKFLPAPIDN